MAGVLVAAVLLASCSAARTGLGTTDESCYLTLPTAAKAVGGHGHLAGVRRFTPGGLRAVAPRLYDKVIDKMPKGRDVCLAAYTGHFTAAGVADPLGHRSGTVAVAVVTTPGNELLGTLVVSHVPVRFQHTFGL